MCIRDRYKNSLDQISKNQILEEIENFKIDEIPSTLIDQELNILNQGLDKEAIEKNKSTNLKNAKKRIKLGLILNQIGEENNIKVENLEIQSEIQKQMKKTTKCTMIYWATYVYLLNRSSPMELRKKLLKKKTKSSLKQPFRNFKMAIVWCVVRKGFLTEHQTLQDHSKKEFSLLQVA